MNEFLVQKEELKKLLTNYSKLSEPDQKEMLENKLKLLIGFLNNLNTNKELLMLSDNSLDNPDYLTHIYSLLCCLEDEIAKLIEKM